MPQPLFSSKPHDWPWHRRGQAEGTIPTTQVNQLQRTFRWHQLLPRYLKGRPRGARVNTLDPYNGMSIARRAFSCRALNPTAHPIRLLMQLCNSREEINRRHLFLSFVG